MCISLIIFTVVIRVLFLQTLLADIGSLEYRASTYIFAKLQKHTYTYTYNSLQFSAEMDTSGRKKHQLLFLFTQILITGTDYQLTKTFFLHSSL